MLIQMLLLGTKRNDYWFILSKVIFRIENCIHAIIVQLLQKLSTLAYFLIGNRQKLINYFRKSISINILDSQVLGIANEKIIKLKFDFHTSFNSYFFWFADFDFSLSKTVLNLIYLKDKYFALKSFKNAQVKFPLLLVARLCCDKFYEFFKAENRDKNEDI
jgi:hypothetical protein